MKSKRILFIINTLDRGGAERSLINLLAEKDFSDAQVDLVILTGKAALIDELPSYVHLINKSTYTRRRNLIFTCIKALFHHGYVLRRLIYLAGGLIQMIIKRRFLPDKLLWDAISCAAPSVTGEYDTAIAYTEGGSAYYVARRVKAREKKALIHIDYHLAGYTRWLDGDCYSHIDRIGAASEDAERSFVRAYPDLAERTYLFENPLGKRRIRRLVHEKSDIHFREGVLRLYTAERLVPQKSPLVSVRAASIMRYRGLVFEWIIAGDGKERGAMEELIKKMGLAENVKLVGELENPYPLMKECDLYVQVSSYEGKSMSVREAAFLGRPVMVSDTSGSITGVDNEIVVGLTPEAIADGIIEYDKTTVS